MWIASNKSENVPGCQLFEWLQRCWRCSHSFVCLVYLKELMKGNKVQVFLSITSANWDLYLSQHSLCHSSHQLPLQYHGFSVRRWCSYICSLDAPEDNFAPTTMPVPSTPNLSMVTIRLQHQQHLMPHAHPIFQAVHCQTPILCYPPPLSRPPHPPLPSHHQPLLHQGHHHCPLCQHNCPHPLSWAIHRHPLFLIVHPPPPLPCFLEKVYLTHPL